MGLIIFEREFLFYSYTYFSHENKGTKNVAKVYDYDYELKIN